MNRKQKIALLNGLLKGEKPMACIFDEWPEKTYYSQDLENDYFTTEDGKTVSLAEVDHELMNYPKVRIIFKEPENQVKISYIHKYVDENGEIIEDQESGARNQSSGENDDGNGFSFPIKPRATENILKPANPDPPQEIVPLENTKPPPEPFLLRKDREVIAQGSFVLCEVACW